MLSNQHWDSVHEQPYHLAAAISERIQENGTKLITFQCKKSTTSNPLPQFDTVESRMDHVGKQGHK